MKMNTVVKCICIFFIALLTLVILSSAAFAERPPVRYEVESDSLTLSPGESDTHTFSTSARYVYLRVEGEENGEVHVTTRGPSVSDTKDFPLLTSDLYILPRVDVTKIQAVASSSNLENVNLWIWGWGAYDDRRNQ